MTQREPVRPRDDQSSDPPRNEGNGSGQDGSMDAEADERESGYAPTSPAHSDVSDMADEFGFSGNVEDPEATPVADSGHAERAEDPFRCEPCDARVQAR